VTLVPRAEAPRFWELAEGGRAEVLDRMARAGAQTVIAEAPAPGVKTDGWRPLPPAGAASPDLILYATPAGVARR
jgi:hypothetical protein